MGGTNSIEYNVCTFEFPNVGMEGEVAFVINIATGLFEIIMEWFYPCPLKIDSTEIDEITCMDQR